MDELFEIERILDAIDFSQGHENAVWERIVARLPRNGGGRSFGEFGHVSGCLSYVTEKSDGSVDSFK